MRTVKLKTGAFFLFDFSFLEHACSVLAVMFKREFSLFDHLEPKFSKSHEKKFARVSPGGQPPRLFEKRIAAPYRY